MTDTLEALAALSEKHLGLKVCQWSDGRWAVETPGYIEVLDDPNDALNMAGCKLLRDAVGKAGWRVQQTHFPGDDGEPDVFRCHIYKSLKDYRTGAGAVDGCRESEAVIEAVYLWCAGREV